MSATKWLPSTRSGNPITAMTTELNSLSSTGTATASTAVSQATDRDMLCNAWLAITYGTNPTANSVIELHFLENIGGTYESPSNDSLKGVFVLAATTSLQTLLVRGIICPPGDFKPYVAAKTTGQNAAASGNTLKLDFYGPQNV